MWDDISNWDNQDWFNTQYNWEDSGWGQSPYNSGVGYPSYSPSPMYGPQPTSTAVFNVDEGQADLNAGGGSFWDQLLKLTPSLLGTGISAYGASQAGKGAQNKAYTGGTTAQTTQQWAPGTLEYIQGLLGSATEKLGQPSINPLQQGYWEQGILPYLQGMDPYARTAGWAQGQMYDPGSFMPGQYEEARQSLAEQQKYATERFPQEVEKEYGWGLGRDGRITQQALDSAALFKNQLEQQKQGLFTQEAAAQAAANAQRQQAMQFGATMYPQMGAMGTQAGLGLLGYPEQQTQAQWGAYFPQMLQLLNILTGHPAGTLQTGTQAGNVTGGDKNSLWSALAAMAGPAGTNVTNALLGQPQTQPANTNQSIIDLLSKLIK